MWTSTLDLDPKRVLITQLLRRVWSGASFSSLAPLQVQNLPRESLPEKTWVRVRNRLAGICGSDLHLVQGDGDFRIAPAALPLHRRSYPGHEVVGEVLEVGEDVQRIRVGDRVVLQYGPNCISTGVQTPCRSCTQGYYNLCEYGKLPGPYPIGGGWSEEMLLPEQQLFRLPTGISDEQAVLLEPTAVAIHAVLRRLPQQNERILITGAGAIGLLVLQIVRALAPQAEVSVLARHSFQIEQATRLGAAHIIYPQDSYAGVQRATDAQIYKGLFGNQVLLGGYDVIFDTVGNQKTLHNALRWARAQATVVLVGVNLHPMHIDLTPVWYQEVNLIGSVGSSVENWPPATNERRSTFEVALELINHNQIHPEHLITHRFPLNNYQTALLTATGKAQSHAIRVVFDYSLLPPSVVPSVRASAAPKRRPALPIGESAFVPENEATPESVPSSAQPAEPAIAIPLSPLFSSSQTVAPLQYEDDEFDEMEDTMPALASIKYDRQAPAPRQDDTVSEQETEVYPIASTEHVDEPFETDEVPSSIPHEQNISQEDDIPSEPETDIYSETTIEVHAIEPEEYAEEPSEASIISSTEGKEPSEASIMSSTEGEEPSKETADILYPTYETSETSTEAVQDSDETFQLPSVHVQEAAKHSEVQTDEVVLVTLEPVETEEYSPEYAEEYVAEITFEPVETEEYNPEYAEEYIAEITFEPAETEEYNPEYAEEYIADITPEPAETSEELTLQAETSEFPEPPIAQEASSPPDSAIEEKTDAGNATRGTENTLLHTEGPTIVKVQNRPRPRTRKKNNRTSVEKR